jgi:hypothetical protein
MTEAAQSSADGLAGLAVEAFFYGFPLVFDVGEVTRFTREGIGEVPATPLNGFGHAQQLADPRTRFVSINNDTVYSIANVDVSGGPVRLDVPDAGRVTTCCSSSTLGPTISPTSDTVPRGPQPNRFGSSLPGGAETRPVARA